MNKFKHFLKRNNLINKFAFRISGGLGDQILMLSFFYDWYLKNKNSQIVLFTWEALPTHITASHESFKWLQYPKIYTFISENNNIQLIKDPITITIEQNILYHYEEIYTLFKHMIFHRVPKKNFLFWDNAEHKNKLHQISHFLDVEPSGENIKYLKMIKETNSVCVHFRFGDDFNKPFVKQNIDDVFVWYKQKIIAMNKDISNPIFYIFTNDTTGLVKKNLSELKEITIIYMEINKEEDAVQELNLMRNCKYFILGWGGFGELSFQLRTNKDGYCFKYWPNDVEFVNRNNYLNFFYNPKLRFSPKYLKSGLQYLRYAVTVKENVKNKYLKNPEKFIKSIPNNYEYDGKFY